MAYSSSGLTRIGSGGGYAVWMYATTDNLTAVVVSGYFNDAANMLNVGDVILTVDTDAAVPALAATVVVSNDGSTVDCGNGTSLSSTDTT